VNGGSAPDPKLRAMRTRVAAKIRADLVSSSSRMTGWRLSTRRAFAKFFPARADVGAAVAADLRFVAHSANESGEFASERIGHAFAERSFSDARRPTRHRIGPLISLRRFSTARNSSKRSLTFARPNAVRQNFFARFSRACPRFQSAMQTRESSRGIARDAVFAAAASLLHPVEFLVAACARRRAAWPARFFRGGF